MAWLLVTLFSPLGWRWRVHPFWPRWKWFLKVPGCKIDLTLSQIALGGARPSGARTISYILWPSWLKALMECL